MTELCGDERLGYLRSRTVFEPGAGLRLDDSYRLAHLPLVAPSHPRVIAERAGAYYRMGRHARVRSLVLPVPWPALAAAPAWRELDTALRRASFAPKLAWDVFAQRRDRLHATICGSPLPERFDDARRRELAAMGPVTVALRGLFSGNVNVGRLYLKVYPEMRGGANALGAIQRAIGRNETDLWVVGIHNLVDDLDAAEASELAALIVAWWDRPLLRLTVDRLWLLDACDDLVLDSEVADVIPLVASWAPQPAGG
ncbi:MAG: hypothetical protein AB7P02_06700 [Alphaproteobacteria bacterium]